MRMFRNGPSAIGASWFCQFVGASPVVVFTFGNFMRPLTQEFGWTRALMSSAFALGAVSAAIMAPVVGRLVDTYGLRAITLPGLVLAAAAVAAQSLNDGAGWLLFLLQVCVGAFTIVLTPLPYSKAISSWYDRNRGLALGVSTIGAAAGAALIPQLAQSMITGHGWRTGYLVLGAAILIVAFIPALLLLHEAPKAGEAGATRAAPVVGVSVAEGRRNWRLWAICVVFLLGAAGTGGLVGQLVPLLTDRGFPVNTATSVLVVFAASNALSRLISGFFLDRVFAPYLAAATFLGAAIGVVLLIGASTYPLVIVAMALCGLAIGLEADLLPFLISRYFGTRAFGELVGYAYLAFTLGTGVVGPLLMGNSSTHFGSYAPALSVCAAGLVVGAVVLAVLGPYAFPARADEAP